jgi:hypothetical protein
MERAEEEAGAGERSQVRDAVSIDSQRRKTSGELTIGSPGQPDAGQPSSEFSTNSWGKGGPQT